MSQFERNYTSLVSATILHGETKVSRAGPTLSTFGTMLTIDTLKHGDFPILTQRKIYPQGILGELAGFLRGATDLQTFKNFGCNYWDANASDWPRNKGIPEARQEVGEIYGYQWRNWAGYLDQLATLVSNLQRDPHSRRHLLTTYNPARLDEMCLPPCHLLAQFNVSGKQLNCSVTMRSVDLCVGLPSDIILYATLLLILCNETGYTPGRLVFMMGDTHVYTNHVDQFQEHVKRDIHPLPKFTLNPKAGINTFVPEDLSLIKYTNEGVIRYAFNN